MQVYSPLRNGSFSFYSDPIKYHVSPFGKCIRSNTRSVPNKHTVSCNWTFQQQSVNEPYHHGEDQWCVSWAVGGRAWSVTLREGLVFPCGSCDHPHPPRPQHPTWLPLSRQPGTTAQHTVLFTCRFQKIACRLPKFPRTHSNAALLCVVVMKKQCEQILATIHIRLYATQANAWSTISPELQMSLCKYF